MNPPPPAGAPPVSSSSGLAVPSDPDVALSPTADGSRSRCVARRPLAVGTLVLAGEPTAAVLVEGEKGKRCDQCLRALDGKPLRCSRCLEDVYCSKACQADAWKRHHRVLCKVLVALSHRLGSGGADGRGGVTEVDRLDALLLARLAAEHFRTAQETQAWDPVGAADDDDALDLPQSQLFLSLMPAPAPVPASRLPALLAPLLPDHLDEPTLARLHARFQRNNHVLVGPDAALRPVAHAALAKVSRAVNHSCLPSGVVVTTLREGKPCVGVRIIRDLAQGDEVTISYLDPLLARSTRRKSLQEIYGFACACVSCATPASRVSPPRLPALQRSFSPIAGRPSVQQLQSVLPVYPSDRLPAAAPTGLSETTVSRKTAEFEDAHADGRWDEAAVAGAHVLEIYWAAYGPFVPLIGTHLLSLSTVNLNWSIVLPVGSADSAQSLCRAAMFAAWARTVLTVVWGQGGEVDAALAPVEQALQAELSAL